MSVVILHLSDIHIKSASDSILRRGKHIARCTFRELPNATELFLIISGDIAYSGKTEQFSLAKSLIDEIKDGIGNESAIPIRVITAPGNHDCDFDLNNSARNILIQQLSGSEPNIVDDSVVEGCTRVQGPYFEFRKSVEDSPESDDNLRWIHSYTVGGTRLVIECLNVSWLSEKHEEPGTLYFPHQRYNNVDDDASCSKVIVMHHPLNWYSQSNYREFRKYVRQTANILVTGHEHIGNVGINEDAESGTCAYIEGAALQDPDKPSESAFNIIVLDLPNNRFSHTSFQWMGANYAAKIDNTWSTLRSIPLKSQKQFQINASFADILDDSGAMFSRPGKGKVNLGDVFVYPDLKELSHGEDGKQVVSATLLTESHLSADGALILGEEKSGRSSLLHRLYREYYDRGFVPLLLNGESFKRGTDREIVSAIENAIGRQYDKTRVSDFEQLSKHNKILFLDNLDAGDPNGMLDRRKVIESLRKRFGHFIAAASETFELSDLLDSSEPRETNRLKFYQIQPFNHSRRSELIQKWLRLGDMPQLDGSKALEDYDQAEHMINSVMNKRLVPSVPFYVLILLMSIDSGRGGELKESALGYYYQYLLTEAFRRSNVQDDKLTEHFQYCYHLAWFYHESGQPELSETELRKFNDEFSKQWHTVNFTNRLELLMKARILKEESVGYVFRYPYIHYFLKGQYLNQNLKVPQIRDYVSYCCKHLYIPDHSNTILFLVHHTNDDFVIKSITESLRDAFSGREPVTLKGDTPVIAKILTHMPKFSYSGGTPEKHRRDKNRLRDDLGEEFEEYSESKPDQSKQNIMADVLVLFKTMEILGQVLKTQYSKILRTDKRELITEIFNGSLRGVRDFWNYVEESPTETFKKLETSIRGQLALKRDNSRDDAKDADKYFKKLSRVLLGFIVEGITFGFFARAIESVKSENLLEEVENVVDGNAENVAFRLIELGVLLDSARPIPRQKIEKILRDVKSDLVVMRLVQIMAIRRLYMFKTSERDMQWVANKLNLKMDATHALAYKSGRA